MIYAGLCIKKGRTVLNSPSYHIFLWILALQRDQMQLQGWNCIVAVVKNVAFIDKFIIVFFEKI